MKTVLDDFPRGELFRWCYAAVVDVAKGCLAKANAEREDPALWPAGQEWDGLSGSSKSIFMHQARLKLDIPDEPFLAIVRSCEVEGLDEIFGT